MGEWRPNQIVILKIYAHPSQPAYKFFYTILWFVSEYKEMTLAILITSNYLFQVIPLDYSFISIYNHSMDILATGSNILSYAEGLM